EIVHRRRLASVREDVTASLGTRPHRLICSTRGDLLWFRGRRVVDVNWPSEGERVRPGGRLPVELQSLMPQGGGQLRPHWHCRPAGGARMARPTCCSR